MNEEVGLRDRVKEWIIKSDEPYWTHDMREYR